MTNASTPTTVVNKYHRVPFDVYIGRGSIWGNPFIIGRDGDRDEVIAKYEKHLLNSPHLIARLPELRGKRLACFCAPRRCHGDVLARYADADQTVPGGTASRAPDRRVPRTDPIKEW